MAILQDLPKIKDIRSSIRKHTWKKYPDVEIVCKDTHVIHHSLTFTGTPQSFANYHIDKHGWPTIAYAFVIQKDGTIYWCNDLFLRTYHAGNTNTRSIGTCLVGDFRKGKQKPTQAQMESLYLLNEMLYKILPNMKYTIGHQECPGYAWKNCPGDGWNYKKVIDGTLVASDDINMAPGTLPAIYTIQEGDTFWSIANNDDRFTLDELIKVNPGVNYSKLSVGQKINLAAAEKVSAAPERETAAVTIEQKTVKPVVKTVSTADKGKRIESIYKGSDRLNFYDKPSFDNPIGTFDYGEGWTIRKLIKVDGTKMYEVENSRGEVFYITAWKEYVKVIDPKPWYIGRRVEAIVAQVNYYDSQRWSNPTGQFSKGEGWTIVDKVKTSGSDQYKVKNSRGKIFYITANIKYVSVK